MNCGTEVLGPYCQACGQENIVTHQNFWSLVTHFVYDVLHFDGKFFETIKYIFTRPGWVAKHYVAGKRKTYLDPIRMYLFTSAVFFLVFFSVEAINVGKGSLNQRLDNDDRVELADYYKEKGAKNPADTLVLNRRIAMLLDTANQVVNVDSLGWGEDLARSMKFDGVSYESVAQYDSVQQHLSADQRHNWAERLMIRKSIAANQKYGNTKEGVRLFIDDFLHKLPAMLFVSLPFFAGILKLLYVRRKNYFYSDHAVFTLYHYIFSFILLLCLFGLSELNKRLHWSFLNIVMVLVGLVWPLYLFLEMKNFYGQSKRKTFLKFILLNLLGFILVLVLFLIFLLISFLQS